MFYLEWLDNSIYIFLNFNIKNDNRLIMEIIFAQPMFLKSVKME